MKERPILFSAPMVRALLDGSKTQTRRVAGLEVINAEPDRYEFRGITSGPGVTHFAFHDRESGAQVLVLCRYGKPGDRLWVRETFYCDDYSYPNRVSVSCHWREVDGQRIPIPIEEQRADMLEAMFYRADGDPEFECPEGPIQWRPSIHMPRWVSRINLEITGMRVERLQDISDADCIGEGIEKTSQGFWSLYGQADVDGTYSPRTSFRALWMSINGLGSWPTNPWLWVVQFKRIDNVELAGKEGATHGQTIG